MRGWWILAVCRWWMLVVRGRMMRVRWVLCGRRTTMSVRWKLSSRRWTMGVWWWRVSRWWPMRWWHVSRWWPVCRWCSVMRRWLLWYIGSWILLVPRIRSRSRRDAGWGGASKETVIAAKRDQVSFCVCIFVRNDVRRFCTRIWIKEAIKILYAAGIILCS